MGEPGIFGKGNFMDAEFRCRPIVVSKRADEL